MECKKIRYYYRDVAEAALLKGQIEGHYDKTCCVYFCLDCGVFHIGHSSPPEELHEQRPPR